MGLMIRRKVVTDILFRYCPGREYHSVALNYGTDERTGVPKRAARLGWWMRPGLDGTPNPWNVSSTPTH